MSFDLYLVPLTPSDDFEAAMALLDELDRGERRNSSWDARDAVPALIECDGRYRVHQKEYAAIARFERISEAVARQRYDFVELNGKNADGEPLAQFVFHQNHITIHCYSGTTADELDDYVAILCGRTGLAAVDPQEYKIWRPQADGTLMFDP